MTAGNNKRVFIEPDLPDTASIRIGAKIINAGGVIVFPTQCLYGLGVDALNAEAVNRIFKIKRRPESNPLLILISDEKDIFHLTKEIPATAEQIMRSFWPGNVTLIFKAGPSLPQCLTAGTQKIGIRLPGHPVARALVKEIGRPITGTSANLSGLPGCNRISELDPAISDAVDLILDAGPLQGGIGSTIVDITTDPPTILREGSVSAKQIEASLKQVPGL